MRHTFASLPAPPRGLGSGAPSCCYQQCPGSGQRWGRADPSHQRLWPQEAAHEGLMCQRRAREARTPEPLRRHRSLTARSLLPLAEKQRRALRDLRRLEGLGLVSAEDGYQGLLDELAKVRARPGVCARSGTRWPLPGSSCPPKPVPRRCQRAPSERKVLGPSEEEVFWQLAPAENRELEPRGVGGAGAGEGALLGGAARSLPLPARSLGRALRLWGQDLDSPTPVPPGHPQPAPAPAAAEGGAGEAAGGAPGPERQGRLLRGAG